MLKLRLEKDWTIELPALSPTPTPELFTDRDYFSHTEGHWRPYSGKLADVELSHLEIQPATPACELRVHSWTKDRPGVNELDAALVLLRESSDPWSLTAEDYVELARRLVREGHCVSLSQIDWIARQGTPYRGDMRPPTLFFVEGKDGLAFAMVASDDCMKWRMKARPIWAQSGGWLYLKVYSPQKQG